MKYKQLFQNSMALTFSNVFLKVINFVLLPLYTRYLTPEQYGVIDLYNLAAAIGVVLVGLEMSQGFARYYVDYDTNDWRSKVFNSTVWSQVLISFGLMVLALPFLYVFSDHIFGVHDLRILFVFVAQVIFQGLHSLMIVKLNWQLDAKKVALISIVNGLSNIAISFSLVVSGYGYLGVMIGSAVSNLIGVVLALYFDKPEISKKFIDINIIKQIVKFSAPLVFNSVSIYLLLLIDRIVLKTLLDLSSVGIFGVAYRFATIIPVFTSAFGTVLTPMIVSNHNNIVTQIRITKLFKSYLLIGFWVCLLIGCLSHYLLDIIVSDSYQKASYILIYLCPSLFIASLSMFLPGLLIQKNSFKIAQLGIFSSVLTLVLNISFVKVFGLNGTGYANLLASLLNFALFYTMANSLYALLIPKSRIVLQFTIFLIFLVAVSQETVKIQYKVFLLLLFTALILFFKWIKPSEVKRMLSQK